MIAFAMRELSYLAPPQIAARQLTRSVHCNFAHVIAT
jgi:hypothetical protein